MHVLIIGAGVAGLTCGRELLRAGHHVTMLEASDGPGGRVRSDEVGGYTLDRGFQVLFEAYPAAQRQLDMAALDLRRFDPGAIICAGGRRLPVADPLRDPASALATALSPAFTPADKLRVARLALELRAQDVDALLSGEDRSSLAFLLQRGFSMRSIDLFFRPFFGGVLLDPDLETSAKCLKFDFKMLASGGIAVPASGMGQISAQLAAPLEAQGRIRYGSRAAALLHEGGRVIGAQLEHGETVHADAAVVATAAPEAARLSGERIALAARGTATLYLAGDMQLYQGKKLLLNPAPGALVNNAQLMTNISPAYAPQGQHLLSVATTHIPSGDDMALFKAALRDLHHMFAGDPLAQAALTSYQPLRAYRIPFAQFAQPAGIHPQLPDNRTGHPGLFFAAEFTEASSINAAMISGEKCAAAVQQDVA